MSQDQLTNEYKNFVSRLILSINKISLYPAGHPLLVNAVNDLYAALRAILNKKSSFNLGFSPDKQALIENQPVTDVGSGLAAQLADNFRKLYIENLSFTSGISPKELEAFIRILLIDPEEIKRAGDINKVFQDKGIVHIKPTQFSYVKIQKGKVALEVDDEAKKRKILQELKLQIKNLSSGKIQDASEINKLQQDIIAAVTAEFKENKKLLTVTKNILEDFILHSPDSAAIISRLNRSLRDAGCSPEEAKSLIDKIEKDISIKLAAASESGKLSKEKASELIKQNAELELKLNQLRNELEAKEAAFEALEKGKERIAQEKERVTQEKERIDNIVRHMGEGLVMVDPQGKILMLNPVAEQLLGIDKDKTNMQLSKALKDEHLLTMVKHITPGQDGTLQKDIELLSPNEATKRVLRTSSAVVEDHNGKTVGMVTILNDITRQKEVEKIKSDFVASVSHELRTPMSTIKQNISLLTEELPGSLNEDQKKFLNIAQDNIKRLNRLIEDLLDSAAIEAGKFSLRLAQADINEVIDRVITFLRGWAQAKNITIEAELLPESEPLRIDKDRIEQVLNNLISNAVKFTPQGGKVYVKAIKKEPAEDSPSGALEISVKDTGPGIAPENLKKVFDKFERAGMSNSGVGGTGLGLSIAQEIVSQHKGKIWAESDLGQGSKFSFIIPINKDKDPIKEPGGD